MAVATPGAGKTTFALTLAAELIAKREVDRIVVVTPTDHLKSQWAKAAARFGIHLDPSLGGRGLITADFTGYVVTYAGLAANPEAHRSRIERNRTLVILDEIHHAGDALSWGEATLLCCAPAARRIALTGTPFRSDANPIPFVTYAPAGDGTRRSVADFSYGYGPALRDGVVRPVLFMAYSGEMQWRTRAGDEMGVRLGEPMTKDITAQALRTALDPKGSWIPAVLGSAHRRLQEVRRDVPDAGGLVIASDQNSARAYARILAEITGEAPTIVLSDEPSASRRIREFNDSTKGWMVAVRMVSEGVDLPRLSVGVYATTAATPLYFAQAVGRFVRARRRGETATIFVPSVPALLGLASEMEAERDHVLGRPVHDETDLFAAEADLLAHAQRMKTTPDGLGEFEALNSQASFDRVVFDGSDFGGLTAADEEELDFIGIPGLLEPDQVAELLRQKRAQATRRDKAGQPSQPVEESAFERRASLRRELNGLVGAWHRRTGDAHSLIHSELRSACGGPAVADATSQQLLQRIDTIRSWALKARR